MKLRFFGTGAGEGYPGRWCDCEYCRYARQHGGKNVRGLSSAMLDDGVLLDMNTVSFDMAARMGVSLRDAHMLLITHAHSDHLYVNEFYWRKEGMGNTARPRDLMICANELSMRKVQGFLDQWHDEFYMTLHTTTPGEVFEHEGYRMTVVRSIHADPGFTSNYIIEKDGKRMLYALDTGGYEPAMEKLVFSGQYDAIVMEGTGGPYRDAGSGHMNFDKNIAIYRRFREAGCLKPDTLFLLSHISPHSAPPHDQYAPMVEKEGMLLAYDGMEIDF